MDGHFVREDALDAESLLLGVTVAAVAGIGSSWLIGEHCYASKGALGAGKNLLGCRGLSWILFFLFLYAIRHFVLVSAHLLINGGVASYQ